MMFGQALDQNPNTFTKDIFTEFLGGTNSGANPNSDLFSPARKNEKSDVIDGSKDRSKYSGLNDPMIPIQEESYSH